MDKRGTDSTGDLPLVLAQDQAGADALQSLKRELNGLGYVGGLLQENYEFADFLSEDVPVSRIPLAAFAQHPPSYRNAAFGVAIANGTSGIELVRVHRALGAPQIFEIDSDRVRRWKVGGEGPPIYLDEARTAELSQFFAQHRENWIPQRILSAKSNVPQAIQLDFFDMGLLPLLEHEARTKLDHQLNAVVNVAIETFTARAEFSDRLLQRGPDDSR